MSKRWSWMPVLVLLAAGCNNETGPSVTPEEQQAIEQLHKSWGHKPGTESGFNYLAWDGTMVPDQANNPIRVVRVKFRSASGKETTDMLYRFADGKPIDSRLNGSGSNWQAEAQMWVRGKP